MTLFILKKIQIEEKALSLDFRQIKKCHSEFMASEFVEISESLIY